MIKKNNFIKTISIVLFLTITAFIPMEVLASNYNLEDYESVIEQVNEMYCQNFAITDSKAFAQNVVNKMTPSDLREMLINNSQINQPTEYDFSVEVIDPLTRAGRNEVVTYDTDITRGSWKSTLYADIETTFFDDSAPKFIRYVTAGYYWDSHWTTYTFRAHSHSLVNFSSTSCKVSYEGVWTIPSTGITDTTLVTYNITYYAR